MILRLVDLDLVDLVDLVATPFQLKQVLKPAHPNSNPAVSFHHHFHGPNPIPLQKSQFHGCFSNFQWFQLVSPLLEEGLCWCSRIVPPAKLPERRPGLGHGHLGDSLAAAGWLGWVG